MYFLGWEAQNKMDWITSNSLSARERPVCPDIVLYSAEGADEASQAQVAAGGLKTHLCPANSFSILRALPPPQSFLCVSEMSLRKCKDPWKELVSAKHNPFYYLPKHL